MIYVDDSGYSLKIKCVDPEIEQILNLIFVKMKYFCTSNGNMR